MLFVCSFYTILLKKTPGKKLCRRLKREHKEINRFTFTFARCPMRVRASLSRLGRGRLFVTTPADLHLCSLLIGAESLARASL